MACQKEVTASNIVAIFPLEMMEDHLRKHTITIREGKKKLACGDAPKGIC